MGRSRAATARNRILTHVLADLYPVVAVGCGHRGAPPPMRLQRELGQALCEVTQEALPADLASAYNSPSYLRLNPATTIAANILAKAKASIKESFK